MAGIQVKTELTEIAIRAKDNRGELDGLLLKWANKVRLDSWVSRKTLRREDAQDLKQEILINIFQRFTEFNPTRANFETWCFNRARQIIRSWIRIQIRKSHPILKKGFRGESIMGRVCEIPDGFEVMAPDEISYDGVETMKAGIRDTLDLMKIQKGKLNPTKMTLEFLDEGKSVKQISQELQTSKSQVRAHIRRLRKAVNIMAEQDTVLV